MMVNSAVYQEEMENILGAGPDFERFRSKSILITGGTGLIASYLTDVIMYLNNIKKCDIDLYIICRDIKKAGERFKDYLYDRSFHLIIQDVSVLISDNYNFDYIIHAASNAHPMAYAVDPVGTMKANLLGTINLLEYAKVHHTERFLFVSSAEVYGENPMIARLKENDYGKLDPMNVRSCYSESKRAAETLCVSYAGQYGLDVVSVRPGFIYGPTMTNESSRADAQFFRKAAAGENIVMKSSGSQERSYCYVADAVTAIFTVLLKGESGTAYNIGDNRDVITIRGFARRIAQTAGVELTFKIPDQVELSGYSTVSRTVLDSERLETLGWKPRFNIAAGVQHTIDILRGG